jgi:hypothetical protein
MAADRLLVLYVGTLEFFGGGGGDHKKFGAIDGWSFLSLVDKVVELCDRIDGGVDSHCTVWLLEFSGLQLTLFIRVSFELRNTKSDLLVTFSQRRAKSHFWADAGKKIGTSVVTSR